MGIDDGGGRDGRRCGKQMLLTVAQTVSGYIDNHSLADCPSRVSYREQQAELRRKLSRVYQLRNAHLLDTMERGVLYPVMAIDWCPGKDAVTNCENLKEDDFGSDLYILQGLYEEVRRIEPTSGRVENNEPRSYIVLGFKSLESSVSCVLEKTWRDWTGARSIYLNLHSEFDLVKIVFYHRVVPRTQLDLFMYIVVVELANVTSDNLLRLLDFVQRTRVERMNGYISLYRDLGIVDTDSNYFSGEERGESRLSNHLHSKNSGSRDSLLASDSPEDFFTDTESRKLSSQSESRKLSSQSFDSCDTGSRSAWRKTSSESYDWSTKSSTLQSDWRACDSSTLQSDWRAYPSQPSDWSDSPRKPADWSDSLRKPSDWSESQRKPNDWSDSFRKPADWSESQRKPADWSDSLHQVELLDTDSVERLNLPAPLQATPCTTSRAESPPIGFTSQVSQLREALSILPTIHRKVPPTGHLVHSRSIPVMSAGRQPPLLGGMVPSPTHYTSLSKKTETMVTLRSGVPSVVRKAGTGIRNQPGSIAGTIRSSLVIKTKQ